MAAEYDFRPKPGSELKDEEPLFYARLAVKRTIKESEFIDKVANRTTFSNGEIKAVMGLIAETMSDYLMDGCSVELNGLGFFTASLNTRIVKSKKEIRAASVWMDGVNFLPTKDLKERLKTAELKRAKYGFSQSSEKYSLEERKALLEEYLEGNMFISRKEYSELTGLLQNKALKDLNGWVSEGFLKRRGMRSTLLFLRKERE